MSDSIIDWIVVIPDQENAQEKRLKTISYVLHIAVFIAALLIKYPSAHMEGIKPLIENGIWVMGGRNRAHEVD
jgi:hypothetical protein